MKSKLFKLAINDFTKGLIVSIFAALLSYAYQVTQSGDFSAFNFHDIIKLSVGALIAYLSKNLLTNSKGETFKTE